MPELNRGGWSNRPEEFLIQLSTNLFSLSLRHCEVQHLRHVTKKKKKAARARETQL